MQTSISADSLRDCISAVIGVGEMFSLNENNLIIDEERKLVTVASTNGEAAIMVYSKAAKMIPGTVAVLLNPFFDNMGQTAEREWFFSFISTIPGQLFKTILKVMAKLQEDKSSIDINQIEVLGQFASKFTDKTLAELEKLAASDLAYIRYNSKDKTADLVTKIYREDWQTSVAKKVSKPTMVIIVGMFEYIFGSNDALSHYAHEATLLGMRQMDAMYNCLLKVCEAMEACSKAVLNRDLKVGELLSHRDLLKNYYEISKCVTPATTTAMTTIATAQTPGLGNPSITIPTTPTSRVPMGAYNNPNQQMIPTYGQSQQIISTVPQLGYGQSSYMVQPSIPQLRTPPPSRPKNAVVGIPVSHNERTTRMKFGMS